MAAADRYPSRHTVTEWVERGHPVLIEAGLALVTDDGKPLRIDRRRTGNG